MSKPEPANIYVVVRQPGPNGMVRDVAITKEQTRTQARTYARKMRSLGYIAILKQNDRVLETYNPAGY